MLQLKDISKEYQTNGFVQKALNHVTLNLRDNEFVAILGPSGSGKTTLLNIIGGLDHYDQGDLIINSISTKKYKDRDWDSYRNHTIGFVFQSYNLIPHQSVLANVELALTISGVEKAQRRQRAQKALEQVGLGEQSHKKPSQMSGGQMQRVAIARALVNDPDILLADEPTGALDSATSVQVMDLLQEVAKDRLVVMVTHNPDLAKYYATRIVELRDGSICSDSNPFVPEQQGEITQEYKTMGKASMSLSTALSLSFHNLKTKKARTILTSFAGSIGIIGIALILSLSSGVHAYIQDVEHDTLSKYPLEIQRTGFDFTSVLRNASGGREESQGDIGVFQVVSDMFSTMDSNDLKSLKNYLDSGESGIEEYTSSIEYGYGVVPQIYRLEQDGIRQVHPDTSFSALGLDSSMSANSFISSAIGTDVFYELPGKQELYRSQYDLKAGKWPERENECVLVLTSDGSMSDLVLYSLGLRSTAELDGMVQQFIREEDVKTPEDIGSYMYADVLGIPFRLVSSPDYYEYDSDYGIWRDKREDPDYMRKLVENGEELVIVGVVQPSKQTDGAILQPGIAYTGSLTRHISEKAADSAIVQQQLENPQQNVFTGKAFGEESDLSDFKLESLFSVDQTALEDFFASAQTNALKELAGLLDKSNLGVDTQSLSDWLDIRQIQSEITQKLQTNIKDWAQQHPPNVSMESVPYFVAQLMDGWKEYVSEHSGEEQSGMQGDFQLFLRTDAAKKIINENLLAIFTENEVWISSDQQVRELLDEMLEGFVHYCAENYPEGLGLSTANIEVLSDALEKYLATAEAINQIQSWMKKTFPTSLTIDSQQMEKMAASLADGYGVYLADKAAANTSGIEKDFARYMNTQEAQTILGQWWDTALSEDEQQIVPNFSDDLKQAVQSAAEEAIADAVEQMGAELSERMKSAVEDTIQTLEEQLVSSFQFDTEQFSKILSIDMQADELMELFRSISSAKQTTLENNLMALDYADFTNPSSIKIYPLDFESKEQVTGILDDYNARMYREGKVDQVITYIDAVGTLMSSVTDIIDTVSYVLIAFVAISLVVSSIMIGVITYISVLERRKEIGILRALGASKWNISQVFNAETFIIGLTAGSLGIGMTLLILIPGNVLIHRLANSSQINAFLPIGGAVILIMLSVLLTWLSGLIPSRKAAKSDPVAALRAE